MTNPEIIGILMLKRNSNVIAKGEFLCEIASCLAMLIETTFYAILYIPVLIASTGSSLDAAIAGRIPEIKPINAANPVPRRMLPIPRTNSKSKALVKIKAIIQTKIKPIIPPIKQSIIASNRN